MNSWRQYQVSRGLGEFMRLLRIMALCLITMAGFSGATLKAQGVAGAIQGTVQDSSGAVIPGATVTASNAETGLKRSVTSSSVGFYLLSNLPPGRYRIEVQLSGFQTAVHQEVSLAIGQQLVLNTTVQVGEMTQQVTVSAEATGVQTTTSEVSGSVSATSVAELPLVNRDFRDLTSLIPGVLPLPQSYSSGGVVGTSNQAYRISIAGGRLSGTAYYLDGLYINQKDGMAPQGVTGGQLGVETVREFRVLVNSYTAEFARAGSGVINMVSRGGTNSIHGSVFEFLRNDNLNARNFFDIPDKAPLARNQFGFSLGGPIQKDKMFYFATWEGLRVREGTSVVSRVPDLNARKGLLPNAQGNLVQVPILIPADAAQAVMDLYPLPNGRSFGDGSAESTVLFSGATRDDLANLRIDRQLTPAHSLFARYTFNDGVRIQPLAQPTFLRVPRMRNQWLSVQEDWVVSPTAVNTLRWGWARLGERANERPAQGTPIGPGVILPGRYDAGQFTIANFGATGQQADGSNEWAGESFDVFQYSDDLVINRGNHTVKLGARVDQYSNYSEGTRISSDSLSNTLGIWRFQTLPAFFAGNVFEFRDSIGISPLGNRNTVTQHLLGAYVQDEYRVLSNLTLNFGLRWEFMSSPMRTPTIYAMQNIYADKGNVPLEFLYRTSPVLAPRAGLAWTPLKNDQSFVVRAGGGIFYDHLEDGFYSNGMWLNYPYRTQTVVTNVTFPNPYATGQIPASTVANTYNYDPYQKVPTSYQFNLSLSKGVGPVLLSGAYVGSQGRHMTISRYADTYPRSIVNGRVFYDKTKPTRNAAYAGDIVLNTTDANSYYHSFQASMKARLGTGSTAEAAYTFSKCIDIRSVENTSDIGALREKYVYDAYNLRNERGACGMDIRQRLALNLMYDLPFHFSGWQNYLLGGWSLSSIIQLSDGAPFNPRVSFPRSNNQKTTGGNARQERPDLAPGVNLSEKSKYIFPGNPDRYYDPAMFALQPEGFLGNAGRNLIVGPGLATVDFSLRKTFPVKGEDIKLQFRSEFYNLFNRVNFGLPEWQIFTNTTGTPNPAAGRISNTSTSSRQIQFALKLIF